MLMPSLFDQSFAGRVFDDFLHTPFSFQTVDAAGSSMSTDVKEFDDKYQLELELPGFAKEDLKAELKDGYLTVKAEHSKEKETKDEKGKYIRRERYYGTYQRSFYVGTDVTEKDIKASFENGVLKLDIPKINPSQEPEIEEKHYVSIEG
jgi:HSP20 family molecular chaperone IbpA